MKVKKGFTLIEMMIAVTILSILITLVYPSYQESVRQSRRADAQAALQGLAQSLEQFYTTNGTYAGAASAGADTGAPAIFSTKSPIDGSDSYYNLKIHAAAAISYAIGAEPIGAQAGDGVLLLKSTGARGWDVDNDAAGLLSGLGASPNEVEGTEWCWKKGC